MFSVEERLFRLSTVQRVIYGVLLVVVTAVVVIIVLMVLIIIVRPRLNTLIEYVAIS